MASRPERIRGGTRALLLLAIAVSATTTTVRAVTPARVQYQGKLLDGAGVPVADGFYSIDLRLYDACIGGVLLLTDSHPSVQTVSGIYSLSLGGGVITPGTEPDLGAVFQFHDVVCLGISVGGDSEMTPRQQILSVPYAIRAAVADNSVGGIATDDDVVWTGSHVFEDSISLENEGSLLWPHVTGVVPPQSHFRIDKFTADPAGQSLHPNGESDEQFMICYNCPASGTFPPEDPSQHQFNVKYEMTYFDGDKELQEVNWNLRNPVTGHIVSGYDGGTTPIGWRQFAMRIQLTPTCQKATNEGAACSVDADCLGVGAFCGGENRADYSWKSLPIGYCENDHQTICTDETALADCGMGVACVQRFDLKLRMDGKLEIRRGLELLPVAAADLDDTGDVRAIRIDAALEPSTTGGDAFGISNTLDYNESADPGSSLNQLVGITNAIQFSGTTGGRAVTDEITGIDTDLFLSQTGAASGDLPQLYGYRIKPRYDGANLNVTEYVGVFIEEPENSGSIGVERHVGLRIGDQLGKGSVEDAAILVEPQSGASAQKGNLWMQGGGWQDGHLQLGGAHLWYDPTRQTVRVSPTAPAAGDAGTPVHSPVGTSASWGGMYWGDSGSPAHDSGIEVCALAGLTCLETYDIGSSSAETCGSSSHGTSRFLVLCY